MFFHHETYRFATLRGFRVYIGRRRVFVCTPHHEFVLGW